MHAISKLSLYEIFKHNSLQLNEQGIVKIIIYKISQLNTVCFLQIFKISIVKKLIQIS